MELDAAGREAKVEIGGKVWRVAASALTAAAEPDRGAPAAAIHLRGGRLPAEEIDLHGYTVEEALERLERFVERAQLHGLGQFKVIHGHGRGRVRAAVRQWLGRHPAVEGFGFGPPAEGGVAVTIVRLKP